MTANEIITNEFNKTSAKILIKKDENTVKGCFKRNRFVSVTYCKKNDNFNVHAYTVSGVELKKEAKENGVPLENLKETICFHA